MTTLAGASVRCQNVDPCGQATSTTRREVASSPSGRQEPRAWQRPAQLEVRPRRGRGARASRTDPKLGGATRSPTTPTSSSRAAAMERRRPRPRVEAAPAVTAEADRRHELGQTKPDLRGASLATRLGRRLSTIVDGVSKGGRRHGGNRHRRRGLPSLLRRECGPTASPEFTCCNVALERRRHASNLLHPLGDSSLRRRSLEKSRSLLSAAIAPRVSDPPAQRGACATGRGGPSWKSRRSTSWETDRDASDALSNKVTSVKR